MSNYFTNAKLGCLIFCDKEIHRFLDVTFAAPPRELASAYSGAINFDHFEKILGYFPRKLFILHTCALITYKAR